MTLFVKRLVVTLFAGLLWFVWSNESSLAQSDPPIIVNYQIQRTTENGRDWLVFTWEALNVDRVTLLHDGREMQSRNQLPDGSFGWPPTMPGAFQTTGTSGTYTLIAENQSGRVEARAKFEGGTCYAWLVPPGNHWSRCRRGGQIASNLSTTAPAGRPRCSGKGRVTSRLNFVISVPNNPFNPAAGTTRHRLDMVTLRRVGSDNVRRLRLSGRGSERHYRFSGLQGGHEYVIALPWSWRGRPQEIKFRCPSSPGEHVIKLRPLHNIDFRSES